MRRRLNERQLGELLDRAQRDLFRLETLDAYDVGTDGGDFARYLAGEPGPDPERKGPWLARLRADADRGLHNRRVHVVRSPVSDYLRFEFEWGYIPNTEAGEDIRILDAAEQEVPRALPGRDFWLMDHQTAVVMHYDGAGKFLHASVAPWWLVPRYHRAVEAAWDAAQPFGMYWQAHQQQYQRT